MMDSSGERSVKKIVELSVEEMREFKERLVNQMIISMIPM